MRTTAGLVLDRSSRSASSVRHGTGWITALRAKQVCRIAVPREFPRKQLDQVLRI